MSPKKALVVGTILLVPVLAFLFLKAFGVNRFSLRTYFPTAVDSTLVEGKWLYDTTYHRVPAFNLTSQTGSSFSSEDVADKLYIAHFFYTSCQGLCKQTSTQLSRVQDAFRFKPEVKILSFSVLPEQDSIGALQRYAQSFRADSSRWKFLTGPKSEIYSLVQDGFFMPIQQDSTSLPNFPHGQRLYLVDKKGQIRGMYDGTSALEVDKLITEVNILLSEYDQPNGKPAR